MNKQLEKGLAQIPGISVSQIPEKLERYISEIELWNPRYGLVKASGEELIIKHILDSLVALPFIKEVSPRKMADIGSGAGLPGIPLSLFLPDTEISLVERSGKRVRFLENTSALLKLNNILVVNQDFTTLKNRYDLITFRAFSALTEDLLTNMKKILNPSGQIFAYKGRKRQWQTESEMAQDCGWAVKKEKLSVPFLDEERYLLILHPGSAW